MTNFLLGMLIGIGATYAARAIVAARARRDEMLHRLGADIRAQQDREIERELDGWRAKGGRIGAAVAWSGQRRGRA